MAKHTFTRSISKSLLVEDMKTLLLTELRESFDSDVDADFLGAIVTNDTFVKSKLLEVETEINSFMAGVLTTVAPLDDSSVVTSDTISVEDDGTNLVITIVLDASPLAGEAEEVPAENTTVPNVVYPKKDDVGNVLGMLNSWGLTVDQKNRILSILGE